MSTSSNLRSITNGFQSSFWTANIMELFERLAYYGQAAIMMVFLTDNLKFSTQDGGKLASIFGGLLYFLPIFAGAFADKFGFKKAFTIAFFILGIGYFLIGSTGIAATSSFYDGIDKFWLLAFFMIFTAIGGSFIKPSVLGTISLTSTAESKSIGYAIYYWLVNIGGAAGPLIALLVRDQIGIQWVYVVSSISCFLMLISTLLFYKEPIKKVNNIKTISDVIKDLFYVLANIKFVIFLLIFSLFWIIFWQIYIVIPKYITDIDPNASYELVISAGAWGIIAFQLFVNYFTKKMHTKTAIYLGFFISSLCWLIIALSPTISFMVIGIVVLSVGEMTQAPRYYEYIADLAPEGQAGLFQGYAFLPIAIGWAVGGTFGGWLYDLLGKDNFSTLSLVIFGVGLLSSVSMYLYFKMVKTK